MDDLIQMKGAGRHVMTLATAQGEISMVRYLDGGWGLQHNRITIAVWEADGFAECVQAFAASTPGGLKNLSVLIVNRTPTQMTGVRFDNGFPGVESTN